MSKPTVEQVQTLERFLNEHRLALGFAGGSAATALGLWAARRGHRRFFRRILNADYVTPSMLPSARPLGHKGLRIQGRVTSVGDADNFRLYHTPGLGWNWLRRVPVRKPDLKDRTIHIRLAGVDAPELAHFGNPAQPFSKEALAFLERLVIHRRVTVDLLSKDRYNRIVGMVFVRRWKLLPFTQNVSLEMVKAGLATVYRAGGAEYGTYLKKLEGAELSAKKRKLGIWSLKSNEFETPRDYKLRHSNSVKEFFAETHSNGGSNLDRSSNNNDSFNKSGNNNNNKKEGVVVSVNS